MHILFYDFSLMINKQKGKLTDEEYIECQDKIYRPYQTQDNQDVPERLVDKS